MTFTPEVDAVPVPGYRLLEPLGKGGFGEVWKCEAPGGLFKAIKFVTNSEQNSSATTQELEALQRVKLIRHPFILSLDRVEVIDGVLVIIMELADQSLHGLYDECRNQGAAGLPRERLLLWMTEAAEALDWMNFEHGLQHLDIKPHNLFIVSNHLKIADFGLVRSHADGSTLPNVAGMTPLYAAPEFLQGSVSPTTDQYSLAVVYQQLLSGSVPFWNTDLRDLVRRVLNSQPDLNLLPATDRPAVARALSKKPEERFPSCQDFVAALREAQPVPPPRLRSSGIFHRPIPANSHETAQTQVMPTPLNVPRPSAADLATRVVPEKPPAPPADGERPRAAERTWSPPPGYKFLQCTSQTPIGEIWLVRDADGRNRRALHLNGGSEMRERFRALKHPGLVPIEVYEGDTGRSVLISDIPKWTLRDRFEECQTSGMRGIPRDELLNYLRDAAEILDTVARNHRMSHLGLNPRNLIFEDERIILADMGVVTLGWSPSGQPAGPLNQRYSAPELFDSPKSPTADQYSLAMIYMEALTGLCPRPARTMSGVIRRVGRPATPAAPRAVKIDLDLLPQHDREVMARALNPEPDERFSSCGAFVQALENAGAPTLSAATVYSTLPPVIPFRTLMGETVPPNVVIPTLDDMIAALLTAEGTPPPAPTETRARLHQGSDGVWEHRFPFHAVPGTLELQIDGFRQHWAARYLKCEPNLYRMEVPLPASERFWERTLWPDRKIQVDLQIDPMPTGANARLTQLVMRVKALAGEPRAMREILARVAPDMFDSLRQFLKVVQDQRGNGRRPFAARMRVFPVLLDLEIGRVLSGVGKDISRTGIRFVVTSVPETDHFFLQFTESTGMDGFVMLARRVRMQQTEQGVEIGACFPSATPLQIKK
jgi:serine/threonine protein kinase